MRERVLRGFGALLGGVAGHEAARVVAAWYPAVGGLPLAAAGVALGGLAGFAAFPALARGFVKLMSRVLRGLEALSLHDLLLAALGLGVGLGLAVAIGNLLEGLPLIGPYVRVAAGLVLGYLGLHAALQRRDEIASVLARRSARLSPDRGEPRAAPKLLDTSAVIDGRIAEICQSGFLDGPLLVPRSVLTELQRVADSADALRRNRGRRGLDILHRLQRDITSMQILDDAGGGADVDAQLVALARAHGAVIVTTDFNLSKVAELQGVRVLNVNQLAQALGPPVLPGEELSVTVVRNGKEAGQGIAYLEDGTMVVVEGGKRHIGETSEVVVTSVLQTSAGRMIFARPRSGEPAGPSPLERK